MHKKTRQNLCSKANKHQFCKAFFFQRTFDYQGVDLQQHADLLWVVQEARFVYFRHAKRETNFGKLHHNLMNKLVFVCLFFLCVCVCVFLVILVQPYIFQQ